MCKVLHLKLWAKKEKRVFTARLAGQVGTGRGREFTIRVFQVLICLQVYTAP